jgi:hypothetical protein
MNSDKNIKYEIILATGRVERITQARILQFPLLEPLLTTNFEYNNIKKANLLYIGFIGEAKEIRTEMQ